MGKRALHSSNKKHCQRHNPINKNHYLLKENKLDFLFVETVSNHPEFFQIPRLQFQTINTLVKRKIKGFDVEVEQLFKKLDKRKDGAGIYNICQKYLTDAVHYKRHFKDILD